MKHEVILYITLPKITEWMTMLDMCQPGKYFVKKYKMVINPKRPVNSEFFMDWINLSTKEEFDKDGFIAAIEFMGNCYAHPDVKVLSDGKKEMWVKHEA